MKRIISLALLAASGLLAQSSTLQNAKGTFQQATVDPRLDSPVASPGAQLALDGAFGDGAAKAGFGVFYKDFVFQTKLSAPISKTAQQATLVDLDGLANKATADFGLTWVKWNPKANPIRQEAACIASLRDSGKAETGEAAKKMLREKTADGETKYPCRSSALKGIFRDQFDSAVDWGTPILLTARAKVGRETYKFTRSPAFADEKQTHTSSELLAGLGFIRNGNLFHAAFQYQKAYEAQDESELCSPLSESTTLRCRTISVGPPQASLNRLISVQGRLFPALRLALNPKITYNTTTDAVSISLPLFLFQAKEGGLNGGVAAGWRSDTRTFKVSVFVGQIFTLLGQ